MSEVEQKLAFSHIRLRTFSAVPDKVRPMMFARADNPDEIAQLLERARLLAEARDAYQTIRNGGMLFFDLDAERARRYREASIWAANQPGGGYENEIESARFMADILDPDDATAEELSLADDYLLEDSDDLPF